MAEKINPSALRYANRLSDHLFVMARSANDAGIGDVLWVPGRKSLIDTNKTLWAACAAMLIYANNADAQSNVSAKSWLNAPSNAVFPLSAPEGKVPYIVVAKGAREDAIQILDDNPIAPLSDWKSDYYAGEEVQRRAID